MPSDDHKDNPRIVVVGATMLIGVGIGILAGFWQMDRLDSIFGPDSGGFWAYLGFLIVIGTISAASDEKGRNARTEFTPGAGWVVRFIAAPAISVWALMLALNTNERSRFIADVTPDGASAISIVLLVIAFALLREFHFDPLKAVRTVVELVKLGAVAVFTLVVGAVVLVLVLYFVFAFFRGIAAIPTSVAIILGAIIIAGAVSDKRR